MPVHTLSLNCSISKRIISVTYQSIKHSFNNANYRVAYRQGKLLSWIMMPLISLVIWIDYVDTQSPLILQYGLLGTLPFPIYLLVIYPIYKYKPHWVPWVFALTIFLSLLHFIGLSVAVFGGGIEHIMYKDQFGVGVAAAIFSAAIFSKGARIPLIYIFGLLLVIFNIASLIYIPEFTRFYLIVTGMLFLAILSVYQSYKRDWRLHQALERIKQREQVLKQKNQTLDLLNRHLESYNYSISHDLKAPLRQARGFTSLLQKELKGKENENISEYLHYITLSMRTMSSLIDAFVSYAKISMTNISFMDLEMEKLVDGLVKELEGLEASGKLLHDIQVGPMPIIKADPALMKKLWYSLLSNAIKFSAEKPHPKIFLGSYEERNHHVFYVKDNGIGFDQQFQQKIFELFQRLHPAETYQGQGVGLALASKIIHAHRGEIWAEGELDKGASFFFKIPQAPSIDVV
ncbi:MAG: ATP-binding protein [Bacteroidota bacterium]